MKKRVLLTVRWPVGGIRTFLRYVYRHFDPADWQFTLIAPDLEEARVLVDEDLTKLGLQFLPSEAYPSVLTFSSLIYKELRRNKYDLVHSHGFTSGICTAFSAKLTGTTHLMTSHDVFNSNQFSGIKGGIKKNGLGFVFRLIDKIHSVSYDAQNNLLEFFPRLAKNPDKCMVIPNGIEVERFLNAEKRDLRGELGLSEDVFMIGFLGRFMSQKGFKYLVEAIEILSKDLSLTKKPLVLCFGDGGFVREEKIAIKQKGLEKYFNFQPFTANVAGTMKGLDLIVMPSLWEACPLQPMEALVCGTPFVGTDCVGLSEVIHDTPAYKVPKANAIALADVIKSEMHQSSRNDFSNYINVAVDKYDVKMAANSLLKEYEELILQNKI